jgi:hypothetical protein
MGTALKQLLLIIACVVFSALMIACVVGLIHLPDALDRYLNGF